MKPLEEEIESAPQVETSNLKKVVDGIIKLGITDDENAHVEEDELHRLLIDKFCPEWVKEEIKRLDEARFSRWCA